MVDGRSGGPLRSSYLRQSATSSMMKSTLNSSPSIPPPKRPRRKPETPHRKWTDEERKRLWELKGEQHHLSANKFHEVYGSYFHGRSSRAIYQEFQLLKNDPNKQRQLSLDTAGNSLARAQKIVILKMKKRPNPSSDGPEGLTSKQPRLERQPSTESSDDDDGDVEFDGRKQKSCRSCHPGPQIYNVQISFHALPRLSNLSLNLSTSSNTLLCVHRGLGYRSNEVTLYLEHPLLDECLGLPSRWLLARKFHSPLIPQK
ncbi:hypothetical protein BDV06DRAFT_206270 [Aspergillus oleicola]